MIDSEQELNKLSYLINMVTSADGKEKTVNVRIRKEKSTFIQLYQVSKARKKPISKKFQNFEKHCNIFFYIGAKHEMLQRESLRTCKYLKTGTLGKMIR
jgi:hypothetical protein